MAKRRKKTPDLATEDMLLAEEDLAAMRPALAVAPELIVQALTPKRRRRTARPARKVKARKYSAKKARRVAPPKRKKTKKARRK